MAHIKGGICIYSNGQSQAVNDYDDINVFKRTFKFYFTVQGLKFIRISNVTNTKGKASCLCFNKILFEQNITFLSNKYRLHYYEHFCKIKIF